MKFRLSQIQTPVAPDKERNLENVQAAMARLALEKPDFVALGEMFDCPYAVGNFPRYAEPEGGETWQCLSDLARRFHVYLSAGSVPERDGAGRVYNTAYVFDREGRQIAKHRKMHLFDIDVKGGQYFRESETLAPGDTVTVFDTEFGKMGLCVCFDARFPELFRLMVLRGAKMIFVPAAFNMTTGPMHWDLMFRSRAVDNQCFVAGTSTARDASAGYVAWGHSLVVSPWGEIVNEADEKAEHITTDIDLDQVTQVREQLPLLSARRTDVYELRELS